MKNNIIKKIEWHPLSKETVYETRIFEVQHIKSISPEGENKTFISLKSPEWAIVLPIIEKNGIKHFVMVNQWRHGTSSILQEFPGGVVNENEKPIEAAKRELLEETGYKSINIEHLGSLFPNPAIMQNMCHIFLAECSKNVTKQQTDNDEFIEVLLCPVDEIILKMGKPPLQHALMCSALFLYLQKTSLN